MTCVGPITNLSTDAKEIVINGIDTGEYVTYSSGHPTLQSMTTTTCTNMATNTVATYRDTRDSQLYRIKKMADDKCWMIDNMKLANVTITSTDSNISSGSVALPTGAISGSNEYDTLQIWDPSSTISCANNTGDGTSGEAYNTASITKCGYLYNFYTAIAATGTRSDLTSDDTTAPGSICPKNWRLPTGYSSYYSSSRINNDFPFLNAKMNNASATTGSTSGDYYQNWLPSGAWQGAFSGYFAAADFRVPGRYGYYWSSTVYPPDYVTTLSSSSSSIYPGTISEQRTGHAVRCVLGS
jgi:uncharacterized protein (TIGR02145 family)